MSQVCSTLTRPARCLHSIRVAGSSTQRSLLRSTHRALVTRVPSKFVGSDRVTPSRSVQAAALNIPVEVLAGGIAAAGALIGGVWYGMTQQGQTAGTAAPAALVEEEPQAPPKPTDAVLVLGATGRVGSQVVKQLLASGRQVVAGVRRPDKFQEMFGADSSGLLFPQPLDVTNKDTLTPELFEGVTGVVSCLGPVFGRQPDGSFGYIDNMSSERVEAEGVASVMAALQQHLPPQQPSTQLLVPMKSAEEVAVWQRLDDVIMGGQSSSAMEPAEDGSGAVWKGQLVVEGGGFCGCRTQPLGLDWSGYDGIQLRVRADGQTFKLNIKTTDQEQVPESTYQATFDTAPGGDWVTVRIPWHNFVPVKQARSIPGGAPLDPARISRLGLVYSRFQFNKMPNPKYKPGAFELQIDGGVSAYKAVRPQVVMLSSACVERNAVIGDDAEARKNSGVPILRLNPGGTLNFKYAAENAIRASGYPYTVVRATGLDSDPESPATCLLEADQGDTINGKVKVAEVADLMVRALGLPDAANKTFEVRRSFAPGAADKEMQDGDYLRLFLKLAADSERWRVGLPPMPLYVPPPPPPAAEEKEAVLADPRVQAVAKRDRERVQNRLGQKLPDSGEETPAAEAPAEKEVVRA